MKRALYFGAWLVCLSCIFAPAQSYWQSRDSNYNVAISGGALVTTWDPATKGSDINLTNGNLTATSTAATANTGAILTSTRSAGKLYLEITYGGGVGFLPVTWYAGLIDLAAGPFPTGYVFASTDAWHINGSIPAQVPIHPVSGSIGSVAIDFTNKMIWYRSGVGNNWNNSALADPATNTGGADFSAAFISGTFEFLVILQDNAGEIATVNVGATAFADTVPAGFSGWN